MNNNQFKKKILFIWSYLVYIEAFIFILFCTVLLILSIIRDLFLSQGIQQLLNKITDINFQFFSVVSLICSLILTIFYIYGLYKRDDMGKETRKRWVNHLILFNVFANADYYEAFLVQKDEVRGVLALFLKRSADKMMPAAFAPEPFRPTPYNGAIFEKLSSTLKACLLLVILLAIGWNIYEIVNNLIITVFAVIYFGAFIILFYKASKIMS